MNHANRTANAESLAPRAWRALLMAIVVLLLSVLLPLGVLLFLSPGTPKPFLDDSGKPLAGSISEKEPRRAEP